MGQVARSGDENGLQDMNPLLIVITALLAVVIGLLCYAAYLLDARERLLLELEWVCQRKLKG